jgi:hypothetical protein
MGEEGYKLQEQSQGQVASAVPAVGFPRAPVHWLSGLVTFAIDSLWSIPEMIAAASVVGLVLVPIFAVISGLCCFVAVLIIQRSVAKDRWGAALGKSLVIGLIAAIPFPFVGSALGIVLHLWSIVQALADRGRV